MISIKKYLSSGQDALTGAALKMSGLLLEGIGLRSVNCDPVDHDTFKMKFVRLTHDFNESCSPSGIPAIAQEALESMDSYNRSVEKNTLAHRREMQAIVGMLTRTLLQETEGSEKSVFNLQSIAQQLEKVYQIDDVRVVKFRLAETLSNLREETSRQKEAAGHLGKQVKQTVAAPAIKSLIQSLDNEVDPVSGLAGPREAEMSFWSAIADPIGKYAVIFCVDRLEPIRSRFGSDGGDRVLHLCGKHIAEKLLQSDRLFRWKGASFVAIVKRPDALEAVRSEIKRVAAAHTISLGDRSVQLTVAASWMVLPLTEYSSLETLVEKVDSFVGEVTR